MHIREEARETLLLRIKEAAINVDSNTGKGIAEIQILADAYAAIVGASKTPR